MIEQVKKLLVRRLAVELECILSRDAARKVSEHVAEQLAAEIVALMQRKLTGALGQVSAEAGDAS